MTYATIDDAFAAFEKHKADFDAALGRCEGQQALGRTGFEAYRDASQHHENLKKVAAILATMISEAREQL